MRIGILSDSHGQIPAIERAMDALRAHGVQKVIHCGDIGAAAVPLFEGIETHFVAGNTDDVDLLRYMIVAPEHRFYASLGTLEVAGRRIAFLHGDDARLLRETIHSGEWNLVCHGHSHVYSEHTEGRTLVLNPGAVWRTSHPSIATVQLPSLDVTKVLLPHHLATD